MVTIVKNSSSSDIGVMDWHRLNGTSPENYIVHHTLGSAPRAKRRRMYFLMLRQALWARNDELARFAFDKCLLFAERKKETKTEQDYWEKGQHPTLWSAEKEAETLRIRHRLLRLCRILLQSRDVYKEIPPERPFRNPSLVVFLPKTWQRAIQVAADIMVRSTSEGNWKLPMDEKLIRSAYGLLYDIYSADTVRKAFGLTKYSSFDIVCPAKEVTETLKNAANQMSHQQAVYFLKTFPDMPHDFLHVFRIEYARKGGAFDLAAPPIQK